jgi:hypothetical protein
MLLYIYIYIIVQMAGPLTVFPAWRPGQTRDGRNENEGRRDKPIDFTPFYLKIVFYFLKKKSQEGKMGGK